MEMIAMTYIPLAEALRPKSLSEVLGQDTLTHESNPLFKMIAGGHLPSLILWGPPGCGKTTLARLLAEQGQGHFETLSAVFSGVADLKAVFERAQKTKNLGQHTLLFVDEIHRFNKSQQDSFLGPLESGLITLIGATTENPSFELNGALLSRAQVVVLNRLEDDALEQLILRAEAHTNRKIPVTKEGRGVLRSMADGDGRSLLGMLESLYSLNPDTPLNREELMRVLQRRAPLYDKGQDSHYNLISALHKSLRGSDTNAALYWMNRMLQGGEDPRYILRRLIRFAVEDVGLADPQALTQAMAADQAYRVLGSPEGELAIAQLVVYLGTAPKSVGVYKAFKSSSSFAKKSGSLMPPKHILNAPTSTMKDLGYGKGYVYDPDTDLGVSSQSYMPKGLEAQEFYTPKPIGFERELIKRLEYWKKLKQKI